MSACDRRTVWATMGLAGVVLVGAAGCRTAQRTDEPQMAGIPQYVRGYEAFQEGDRDAAVRELLAAVEDNPNLITARSMLADIYRREGSYDRAIAQYQTLTKLDPYDYINFYHLGVSQHFTDRLRQAVASYQAALRLKPDDPKANMNLGLAHMALGETQQALPYARRATELQPDNAAAWGNLALVLDSSGQHADAEQAYRRSLELDSAQPGVRLNYATNLIRQNRPQEAIAILERLVGEHKTVLAHRRLGDAYLAANQPDKAVGQYEAALAMNERYFPAINQLADLKIREYDRGLQLNEPLRQQAIELWRRSLSVNPQQPAIRENLKRWDKPGAS